MTETPLWLKVKHSHSHNPGPGDVCGTELPNVLTPHNGDDANTYLIIDGLDNYLQTSGEYIILRVFDRWEIKCLRIFHMKIANHGVVKTKGNRFLMAFITTLYTFRY